VDVEPKKRKKSDVKKKDTGRDKQEVPDILERETEGRKATQLR